MNREEKEAILDKLRATKRKAEMLEIDLLFKGRHDDARKVKGKSTEISGKIDSLIANIMQEWIDDTSSGLVEKLKKKNRNIQDAIRDIKKDIKIAKNVVKTLGYMDEAIEFATNLLNRT